MAINFKKLAVDTLSLSPLMVGRTQLTTEELIGKEYTIIGFDFASITDEHGDEKVFPVVIFLELPNRYYNGGAILSKLCETWTSACGGDVETASDALRKEGGVCLRFSAGKTKRGNNIVSVQVV